MHTHKPTTILLQLQGMTFVCSECNKPKLENSFKLHQNNLQTFAFKKQMN